MILVTSSFCLIVLAFRGIIYSYNKLLERIKWQDGQQEKKT